MNDILCESDCSELSWSDNSSDEMLYDDIIVRPSDDSASDDSDSEIIVSGPNTSKRMKVMNKNINVDNSSSSSDVIATTEWQWTTSENNPTCTG